VKICGLVRREDALAADRAGADYLGVVLSAGFLRSVEPERARAVVEGTRARKVAVLVDEDAEAAEAAGRTLGASVLQLHGDEEPTLLLALRERGPWALWKSVRARSLDDIRRTAERFVGVADGILVEGAGSALGVGGARIGLDSGSVRKLVPREIDFVLAGGLDVATVADAVRRFEPDVVDVSSGVEREPGAKDHALVDAFVRAARGAVAGVASGATPRVQEGR
jgi:phosphoribosylanthranilate isomerase